MKQTPLCSVALRLVKVFMMVFVPKLCKEMFRRIY